MTSPKNRHWTQEWPRRDLPYNPVAEMIGWFLRTMSARGAYERFTGKKYHG